MSKLLSRLFAGIVKAQYKRFFLLQILRRSESHPLIDKTNDPMSLNCNWKAGVIDVKIFLNKDGIC